MDHATRIPTIMLKEVQIKDSNKYQDHREVGCKIKKRTINTDGNVYGIINN